MDSDMQQAPSSNGPDEHKATVAFDLNTHVEIE
jgi:hypothetical protein